jgi:LysM repeat protein
MTTAQYNATHMPIATPVAVPNPPAPVSNGTGGTAAPAPTSTASNINSTLTPLEKAKQEANSSFGGNGITANTAEATSFSQSTSSGSAGGGTTYTVKSGDTLSGIADTHGIALAKLEELNSNIKNPNLILPGQTVNIDGGQSGATPAPTINGFPTSSSYQAAGSLPNGSPNEGGQQVSSTVQGGWGTGGVATDPAKGAIAIDTNQNTNPLHINDKTQKS